MIQNYKKFGLRIWFENVDVQFRKFFFNSVRNSKMTKLMKVRIDVLAKFASQLIEQFDEHFHHFSTCHFLYF